VRGGRNYDAKRVGKDRVITARGKRGGTCGERVCDERTVPTRWYCGREKIGQKWGSFGQRGKNAVWSRKAGLTTGKEGSAVFLIHHMCEDLID